MKIKTTPWRIDFDTDIVLNKFLSAKDSVKIKYTNVGM